MTSEEMKIARGAAFIVAALVLLRLVAAAFTPLTFDEAYYWTWSKHLAGGYYDHPPMVAVVIRLGTTIGGDTEFGVRLVSILLALPMSWAVYHTAEVLFSDVRVAALATVLLNATLMVGAGTVIVTPDAPLMVTSAFVLLFQAKVLQTGRGVWWLAVGAAAGCALLSKYTALFFGAQIMLWLLLVKDLQRWLASPWPYLGGVLALAIFSPVLLWNADHHWVSFIKQLGRARVEGVTLKFLGEIVPAQFAFATPSVFILGVLGLYALLERGTASPGKDAAARTLINTSFWTIFIYFIWHSLHERVDPNWLGPIYPAFAIAAAYAAYGRIWAPREQRTVDLSRRWALPIGAVLFIALVVQTNTGLFTGFRHDPTVRTVAVGWRVLASDIEAIRARIGAHCVIAHDYGTTSLLAFYLPKETCVAQRNQRIRWVNMPEPDNALLKSRVLLVGDVRPDGPAAHAGQYAHVEKLADISRKRSGVAMETYELDLLEGAKGDPLDRSPPPELGGRR
jgi:4-amino-4-deoxy-L-arabinose transferase-like glycosyltransferase